MRAFPGTGKRQASNQPLLTQEAAGFHLGIAGDLEDTGRQAAATVFEKYQSWQQGGRELAETRFKSRHFSIAVGGGNTVKAVYRALLEDHAYDINWVEHIRFFFLEESTGEHNWVSAAESLTSCFIHPLANNLAKRLGMKKINRQLAFKNGSNTNF